MIKVSDEQLAIDYIIIIHFIITIIHFIIIIIINVASPERTYQRVWRTVHDQPVRSEPPHAVYQAKTVWEYTTLRYHSSIHLSIHPFIQSSINPPIHLFIHPSIYSSIHPSIYSSVHLFIHLSIHLFNHLSILLHITRLYLEVALTYLCMVLSLDATSTTTSM
jgi:hypothetical protein